MRSIRVMMQCHKDDTYITIRIYSTCSPLAAFLIKALRSMAFMSLGTLNAETLASMLSFVVAPLSVCELGELIKTFSQLISTAADWYDTSISTEGLRRAGSYAYRHYLYWIRARHIISGKWQLMNVMMSKLFVPWTWSENTGSPVRYVDGITYMISQSHVPLPRVKMQFNIF